MDWETLLLCSMKFNITVLIRHVKINVNYVHNL